MNLRAFFVWLMVLCGLSGPHREQARSHIGICVRLNSPVGASLLAMAACQTTKMSGMGIDRNSHRLQQRGLQGLQSRLGRHDLGLDRHGFLGFLLFIGPAFLHAG